MSGLSYECFKRCFKAANILSLTNDWWNLGMNKGNHHTWVIAAWLGPEMNSSRSASRFVMAYANTSSVSMKVSRAFLRAICRYFTSSSQLSASQQPCSKYSLRRKVTILFAINMAKTEKPTENVSDWVAFYDTVTTQSTLITNASSHKSQ